ncbi:MAG: hypothetical protein K6E29_06730 [Cyanobacteria bacterium RUI128]|nr:hypothetical protein [Cyanobacteria bacterium RUI128]
MDFVIKNGAPMYVGRNVQIKDLDSIPNQTVEKLRSAGDVIDNYARVHGSSVVFYDARKDMGEFDVPSIDRVLTESVGIGVKNNKRGVMLVDYVNRYGNEVEDKPFLRTVYEKVQQLVEGKNLRITEHKEATILNLIKAGKIKA